MSKTLSFDINDIQRLIPHRYPFLLLDRIVSMVPSEGSNRAGSKTVAIKNVTINEEFFQGHFPGNPIMPGVLIIEALAQAGGFACYREGDPPMQFIMMSVKGARFRKPVGPGDQLMLESAVIKDRGKMVVLECVAKVDGEVVAEAEIMAAITPAGERL